jgi:hypothetical protein
LERKACFNLWRSVEEQIIGLKNSTIAEKWVKVASRIIDKIIVRNEQDTQ